MANMLTNNPVPSSLIVIPTSLLLDWPCDHEMQTAIELSKKNVVIVYAIADGVTLRKFLVNPKPLFPRRENNLYVFRPLYLIPFQRFRIVRLGNIWLSSLHLRFFINTRRSWKRLSRLFWTFSLQQEVFPHHFGKTFFPVYDCVDAFTSENPRLKRLWENYEKTQLKQARVIFANQHTLYKRMRARHRKTFCVPAGFNESLFRKSSRWPEPTDLKTIQKPRICFIGNINTRIDFDFVFRLAKTKISYAFVFIGAIDDKFTGPPGTNIHDGVNRLKKLPNVYFLGPKHKTLIASYIASCDIGIIPYDTKQKFNICCFPMKTLEYFYLGKPVIATPIPELTKLSPYVFTTHDTAVAGHALDKLIGKTWSRDYKTEQRRIARNHSWQNKIRSIRTVLHKEYSITI